MIGDRREFDLPLERPLETAAGSIRSREGTLVRIEGEKGDPAVAGIGEATPLPGWTESLPACRAAIDRALDRLETGGPSAALDATEGMPAARHGVSLALLDREARATEDPLYRHLGETRDGAGVESIPANATVGDAPVEASVRSARRAVREGFDTLKIKVGAREVPADTRRIEAIHEAVEDGVTLRADANGSWSLGQARRAIGAFPSLEYVEQPLAPGDLAGHADLREHTTIALDETLAERPIEAVLEAGAADVVVLKPMVLGGIDRARAIAETARTEGVDPVVTTTIDGAVARVGAIHLAAGLGVDRTCGLATAGLLAEDLAPDPTRVSGGRISVPRGAGTGVNVAWPP